MSLYTLELYWIFLHKDTTARMGQEQEEDISLLEPVLDMVVMVDLTPEIWEHGMDQRSIPTALAVVVAALVTALEEKEVAISI